MSNATDIEDAVSSLETINDCIRWGVSQFREAELYFGHGTDNEFDEAVWLVLHSLSLPLDLDASFRSCRLTKSERQRVIDVLMERVATRKPAAYLTGEAWFCGLPFHVNENVLVPRSPIGELIQEGFEPWVAGEVNSVLDLCTGSGCIGIACAYAFPEAEVTISDISPEALEVAKRNVERHKLHSRVDVVQSDIFESISEKKYSLIVSNPPYVDAEDMSDLPEEYRQEPELGLAAGDDGLDIVRVMLKQAARYLEDDGLLIVEVGNSADALVAAFPELEFMWPEFEHGGHGVFALTADQLKTVI